eukprot:CAMPEP_0177475236 /NCGR_PEP_ID=MMETSP0369-20130122/22920_1 /TAXON_ID=447022 ORGANISM="Scrippsiella hangoei-like, Strain SHHI-4" /NCGR_SAMPLE_ID=MMETSP0369 /ASSEMBLY_ACC=CAM_ASM_000364 /LENGTH=453 /DNA_ID=CAMNT_0018950335 /DNA_START=39 /DNA_END=1399 /DNA_ORIENTATION=-
MGEPRAGAFFDQHLRQAMVSPPPPSFAQPGPNLLPRVLEEDRFQKTAGGAASSPQPQPESFWRFSYDAGTAAGGAAATTAAAAAAADSRNSASPTDNLPNVEVRYAVDESDRRIRDAAGLSGGFCGLPFICSTCTSGSEKKSSRCCRCKQPCTSYFDHACPKCRGIVCVACLDDFRMILTTYRCPKCGEDEENRATLQHEVVAINLYRSVARVASVVGSVARGLVMSPNLSSQRQPGKKHAMGASDPVVRAQANPDATPATPEHHTRLPANWYHGALPSLSGGKSPAAPKAQEHDDISAGIPEHHTRLLVQHYEEYGGPNQHHEDVAAAIPEHHTRLPVNWHACMAGLSPASAGAGGNVHRPWQQLVPPPSKDAYHAAIPPPPPPRKALVSDDPMRDVQPSNSEQSTHACEFQVCLSLQETLLSWGDECARQLGLSIWSRQTLALWQTPIRPM